MIPPARALRRAFIGAAVTWALALPLATLAASRPHPSPAAYVFALLVYVAGGVVCHQLPERSFQLWAHQMPVCARCTGIYLGAAVAAVITAVARGAQHGARGVHPSASAGCRQPRDGRSPERLALRGWRSPEGLALLAACIPTTLTLVYQWTTGEMPAHWIRAAAGVPIGAVVAVLVVRHATTSVTLILSPSKDEVH